MRKDARETIPATIFTNDKMELSKVVVLYTSENGAETLSIGDGITSFTVSYNLVKQIIEKAV